MTKTAVAVSPVQRLKQVLDVDSVQEQFQNALAESAPLFTASLIDLYSSEKTLQACNPSDVIVEALKAATMRLPINKALGFAYIVPFKEKGKPKPQMIIGYKGLIQLAMRTGFYRFINADKVYEGELSAVDKLTGWIDLSGEKTSDEVVGYFAYLETTNGFQKTVYWTKEEVIEHARKYSRSYNSEYSPWQTEPDAMAIKTVLRTAISKWGIMSVELQNAVAQDLEADVDYNPPQANSTELDIEDADFVEIEMEADAPPEQEREPVSEPDPMDPGF